MNRFLNLTDFISNRITVNFLALIEGQGEEYVDNDEDNRLNWRSAVLNREQISDNIRHWFKYVHLKDNPDAFKDFY